MKIISTTFLFILLLFLNFQASSESKNSKWVNLFNGKDFSGWHNPYPHGEFKVVKGIIELVGNKKFFLAHDKKFSDFTLEAEIKLPAGKANSGFLFRSQKKRKWNDVWLSGRSGWF